MLKLIKKIAAVCGLALAAAALLCGCSSDHESNGKLRLTFQIWDDAQRGGMQDIANAYMARHPEVSIEVQVTSWDEYWTKLDAAAESNQLPDIFWMHTNQILKYADYGKLADLTDLYDYEDPEYYRKHFSDISLDNARGSDGRIYGVPKDKDSVCLVYNRELFDAAGLSYPDDAWTWDDLVNASQTIYDKTGKYGYMAYADEQLGYWNFVYQAGGYILNEDKTRAGFDQPATKKGMEFYIGLQSHDWCPDQNYFAETNPGTAFISEQGAMYLEGNWNLMSMMKNNMNLMGKWDVAVLPKCPDPLNGDGRATISMLRHRRGWKTPGGSEGFPPLCRVRGGTAGAGPFRSRHSGLHRSGGHLDQRLRPVRIQTGCTKMHRHASIRRPEREQRLPPQLENTD